jgi:hypothetical protein
MRTRLHTVHSVLDHLPWSGREMMFARFADDGSRMTV